MYTDKLKFYKDFPKEGINFVDIIPFIQDRETFSQIMGDIAAAVTTPNLAAVEARGFLFSTPLLMMDSTVENVIAIRKSGKLPYADDDLQKIAIVKEYGEDVVNYRISDIAAGKPAGDVFEITLFDDILATGGTALGIAQALNACKVVKDGREYGVKVKEFVFLLEIAELEGKKMLEELAPVKSIIVL